MIGKSARTRWFEILHGSVVHDLVRRSGNISVHVIAGDTIAGEPIPKKSVRAAEREGQIRPAPYIAALAAVALALGFSELIAAWIGAANSDLIFLTAIVAVAVRFGLLPSLLASVASSLSYNFFFLPPIYTFTITDPTNVVAFVFFTLVGIIVSSVAARGRTQARAAMERARTTESLYSFSRKLAGTGTLDDVSMGHGLPDRTDVESAGHAAIARRRIHRGEGGLPAGGYSRRRRPRRGKVGV